MVLVVDKIHADDNSVKHRYYGHSDLLRQTFKVCGQAFFARCAYSAEMYRNIASL